MFHISYGEYVLQLWIYHIGHYLQILQGLLNMTLSIFALASFIVLIKQIIIDVEFLELSGAYRITIKEIKLILNHQVLIHILFDFLPLLYKYQRIFAE